MSLDSVFETCIFNSSSLPKYRLQYFNWMVQIVSFQNICAFEESRRVHVLRVWDGHEITLELKHFCRFVSTEDDEVIVPPAAYFNRIPDVYYIDILVFGEWITRASTLKSGSIVVLKNVHSYMGGKYKLPILTLHQGNSHGRDIVEIPADITGQHYRLLKFKNDIDEIIMRYSEVPNDGASHIQSTTEYSTLTMESEECNGN